MAKSSPRPSKKSKPARAASTTRTKSAPRGDGARNRRPRLPEADTVWSMYRKMVEIRSFEEHVWDVYTRGLMPGLAHLYIGEEAVAVGACATLSEQDYITSTHRGHGHCLAKGAQLNGMMAEIMGKEAGYCRGKGGSMHIADMSVGNLGANGIVGGSFGIATGAAFSAKLRKTDQVAVCFFGDGAANQGILMEAANMAVIWDLPVIYLCENNQYGEHTPFEAVTGVKEIVDRAKGFGMPGERVDGSDVLAVFEVMTRAVAKAREGGGPTFVEAVTYRFRGHHVGDAAGYRTKEELAWWMDNKDPIQSLSRDMLKAGIATDEQLQEIQQQVETEVIAAVEFAREAPYPSPEQAFEDVYS
jgi:acetoin:2,6-dichlorophenolindophenol oxidoreductase subunit alpha